MPPMQACLHDDLQPLITAVQTNCHISDAEYAANYTLCIYLLKMREFYRWETGLDFQATLSNETVGNWLKAREQLWETLAPTEFEPLPVKAHRFGPFETTAINQVLLPQGLVYSGGLGYQGKPHFFLGQLERQQTQNGFSVVISSSEYARDLTAPPAMTQGDTIFIRRESLRRMMWEKIAEWRWNRPDNAMGRMLAFYDVDGDLDTALAQMTDDALETLIMHEVGEAMAGEQLGEAWHTMLQALPRCKAEIMVRSVRDHLADALSTLPRLLESNHAPTLHFYFATLTPMQKHLFPALQDAYQHWHETQDIGKLKHTVEMGQSHWSGLTEKILQYNQNQANDAGKENIEKLIESHRL